MQALCSASANFCPLVCAGYWLSGAFSLNLPWLFNTQTSPFHVTFTLPNLSIFPVWFSPPVYGLLLVWYCPLNKTTPKEIKGIMRWTSWHSTSKVMRARCLKASFHCTSRSLLVCTRLQSRWLWCLLRGRTEMRQTGYFLNVLPDDEYDDSGDFHEWRPKIAWFSTTPLCLSWLLSPLCVDVLYGNPLCK